MNIIKNNLKHFQKINKNLLKNNIIHQNLLKYSYITQTSSNKSKYIYLNHKNINNFSNNQQIKNEEPLLSTEQFYTHLKKNKTNLFFNPYKLSITDFFPYDILKTTNNEEIQQNILQDIEDLQDESSLLFSIMDKTLQEQLDLLKYLQKENNLTENYQKQIELVSENIVSSLQNSETISNFELFLIYTSMSETIFIQKNNILRSIIITEFSNRLATLDLKEKYYYLFSLFKLSSYNKKKYMLKFVYDNILDEDFSVFEKDINMFHIYLFLYSEYSLYSYSDNFIFIQKYLPRITDKLHNIQDQLSLFDKAFILNNLKFFNFKGKKRLLWESLSENFEDLEEFEQNGPENTNLVSQTFYNLSLFADKNSFDLENIGKNLFYINLDQNNKNSIINIARALVYHDIFDEYMIRYLIDSINYECKKKLHYSQNILIYQILSSFKLFYPEQFKEISQEYDSMEEIFVMLNQQYIQSQKLDKKNSYKSRLSEFEKTIFSQLQQFISKEKIKCQAQIGLFTSDFLIKDEVILEVYGNHHYRDMNNLNYKELWRQRYLKQQGYSVEYIQTHEWNKLKFEDKQIEFLKNKLQKYRFI